MNMNVQRLNPRNDSGLCLDAVTSDARDIAKTSLGEELSVNVLENMISYSLTVPRF